MSSIDATEAALEPPLWRLVGATPLIEIDQLSPDAVPLFLKAEWLNPGGSVKDRPAREIMRAGFNQGLLPDRILLDASSGNTAVAYAMLGAAAGIDVTVCVPSNASPERIDLIRTYGAEIILTDPLEGTDGAILRAREISADESDRYWYADQYNNDANVEAHFRTTGPEIWNDTGGAITHLVAGVGTSGTIMGAGKFLKQMNPSVQLVGVQPDGPLHGLEGLKRMDAAIVPGIYDPGRLDETIFVATDSAESEVRELARSQGIFVGWSAGAALFAGRQVAREAVLSGDAVPTVVVIAPDGGGRYLSERDRLMGEHNGYRC